MRFAKIVVELVRARWGERGGIGGLQVRAQPVEQPALVAGGAFVVAADRAQFPAEFTVRNKDLQCGMPVWSEQTADPGVRGVVLLPCRPRGGAPPSPG
jgi:hypothetical protein